MGLIGYLIGSFLLGIMIFSTIQVAFLWAGHGAVDTAAHFAARKFALNARGDFRNAKATALAEASSLCRNRPGGNWESAAMTSVDFARGGMESSASRASAGEAYQVRLTHWMELIVPWADRILYSLAPLQKTRVGDKYYLALQATRWVTVE